MAKAERQANRHKFIVQDQGARGGATSFDNMTGGHWSGPQVSFSTHNGVPKHGEQLLVRCTLGKQKGKDRTFRRYEGRKTYLGMYRAAGQELPEADIRGHTYYERGRTYYRRYPCVVEMKKISAGKSVNSRPTAVREPRQKRFNPSPL